jgi:hypothetical protein
MLIGVLIFLLVLSFLGINLLSMLGGFYDSIVNTFGPIVYKFLALLGFTTGTIIHKTADVVGDTAKLGVDLSEGAVHDVGDLLLNAAKPAGDLDNAINLAPVTIQSNAPAPDKSDNPIQNPVTAAKTKWCLVGEYQGRRGCVEITDQDKCLSGQVFPEQKMCLNPTLTSNMP